MRKYKIAGGSGPSATGEQNYFGNGPKFIKENRFDMIASLTQMFGGAIGVLIAYFIVKSMPLQTLLYVVCVVVEITAVMFFVDYAKAKKNA